MTTKTNPIIFVHGIQGSWLKNQYEVDYQNEIYWTGILKKKFSKLHLDTTNQMIDKDIDSLIFPHQSVPIAYESIIEELREEVSKHTFMFTYDWRKDNKKSALQLKEFVELILLKYNTHSKGSDASKVTLIGHSMGGLVIKWYVKKILGAKASSKIDKIITVATPYGGSLKSVEAILPGARNFFGVETKKAMRSAARTFPGLFQLLPSWSNAVIDKATGKNLDIFDQKNWQTSLVTKVNKAYGKDYFQTMLNDAKAFTSVVKNDYQASMKKHFYCIYGVESDTLRQVKVDTKNKNFFEFNKAIVDDEGDGTVHFLSSKVNAQDHFVDKKKFIEIGGQHVQMCNHELVQDYIVGILKNSKLSNIAFESTV